MKNALPILAGVVATVLYLATAQRAFYDDGIRFEFMLRAGELAYIHVLYLPIVALVREVVSWVVPIEAESALKITAALFGGLGVGLTADIAQRTLGGRPATVAVVVMLAGSFGYWFHATTTELHAFHAGCAALLLLALVRIIGAPERTPNQRTPNQATPRGLLVLLGVGALVTPASHASGVATGLPILFVLYHARAQRWQLLITVAVGFALWAGVYLYLYYTDDLFPGYSAAQSDKLPRLLRTPSLWPAKLQAVGAEMFLYCVPASTLVPAGFRALRCRAPLQAWLYLLWILGWAIIALPVGDRAYGSNFIATMPAQAVLAIAALQGLGVTVWRMVLATLIAFSPVPASFVFGEIGGLVTFALAAGGCFWLADPGSQRARWLHLAPVVLLASSAVMMALIIPRDPIRAYLRRVSAAVGPTSVVIFLEKVPNTHAHWIRYFPGADGPDPRAFNPFFVESLAPGAAQKTLDSYRARIRRQVAKSGRIFYVEKSTGGLQRLNYPRLLAEFVGELHREFEFVTPPGDIPRLQELERKRQ